MRPIKRTMIAFFLREAIVAALLTTLHAVLTILVAVVIFAAVIIPEAIYVILISLFLPISLYF